MDELSRGLLVFSWEFLVFSDLLSLLSESGFAGLRRIFRMVGGGVAGKGTQVKLCPSWFAVTGCRPARGLGVLGDSVMAVRYRSPT